MLRLASIVLNQNPDLIQPPKVDDNIVVISLLADANDIIAPDIIDVAMSYAVAGIDVVLEMDFANYDYFDHQKLASLICNGGWSLSLLPPQDLNKDSTDKYCQIIIDWYQFWRGDVMLNFDKIIYPITPYAEYLTINHLIAKNKEAISKEDSESLKMLSKNPTDPYAVNFIKNMQIDVVGAFKLKLNQKIESDKSFYTDVDLLTDLTEHATRL